MRNTRIIALFAALCLVASCLACTKPDPGKDTSQAEPTTAAPTTAAPTTEAPAPETEPVTEEPGEPDAETAMNNFVKKLEAGNYVLAPKNYVKTTAYSPEQVTFINGEGSNSDNYAFFTLNGETFQGIIDKDRLVNVVFASRDNAIGAVERALPNYWIKASGGNMFELFYNNVDNALEFTSNDKTVKTTLLGLAGYPEIAIDLTEEVHMLLDKEDPDSVRFTAHVNQPENRMYHFNDLDLQITFGTGTSDPRVEAWLKDPVYPPTKTYWDELDVATLDQVFNRGYGAATVPFPRFASYALLFDESAYKDRTEIYLSDGHATEKDVEDYGAALLNSGFEAVSKTLDGNDVTVYRKLLRPQYNAYAELYPYYEDGFVLRGGMYYEDPEYDGLEAINKVLEENGFASLEETDNLGEWKATDVSRSRTESWAFFFDYLLYMPLSLEYQDYDAAKAYLTGYGQKLVELGFKETYVPGMDREEFTNPSESRRFRYTFNQDGTLTLEFKNEKVLTIEEATELMQEHGLPVPALHGEIGTRDLTRYQYEISSFTGLYLAVGQYYDSAEEARAFLDSYAAALEEQGFIYFNPAAVASNKHFCYLNEELRKYVAFDYFEGAAVSQIQFDFVSIEPEEDDLLHSILRR